MPRRKRRGFGRAKQNGLAAGNGGLPSAAGAFGIGTTLSAFRSVLTAQRAALDAAISGLETAMGSVGAGASVPAPRAASPGRRRGRRTTAGPSAAAGPRRRGRKPSGASLKAYIIRALSGKPSGMQVKDIADAVMAAGYKTKSSSFGNQVSAALAGMNETAKLGRGLFRLR